MNNPKISRFSTARQVDALATNLALKLVEATNDTKRRELQTACINLTSDWINFRNRVDKEVYHGDRARVVVLRLVESYLREESSPLSQEELEEQRREKEFVKHIYTLYEESLR